MWSTWKLFNFLRKQLEIFLKPPCQFVRKFNLLQNRKNIEKIIS